VGLPGYQLSVRAAAAERNYGLTRLKSAEGEYREGPYCLPVTGGWLPEGSAWNWWQTGADPLTSANSSMVQACVSAYAETVAMCPGNQWVWSKEKGRERVTNSALVRILKRPNDYLSISDFLMNLVGQLYREGNAYALIIRNNRFEPQELHLMDSRQCAARVSVTGEIFYHLGGNPIIEARIGTNIVAPAREVLHLRLMTPRHPLVGETPLAAAALELAAGSAALQQQVRFFINQARPSFLLTTDTVLTREQTLMLRESWNEQSRGLNRGGTPILSAGLKAQAIGSNADDSQLAEILKLSDEAIARVFRVPMQVFGSTGGTPYASTEALMQSWRAGGLGFVLNHIEEAIGNLFKLGGQPDEYLEFDTSALLRSAFKERVEGWVAGVKGGIFDRNTARADFEQAPVDFGDEPWVQQQDIPLSVAGESAKNPPAPPAPPAAAPEPVEPDPDQARAFAALFEKDLREALRA
jgi:HK97 family phage portal protein